MGYLTNLIKTSTKNAKTATKQYVTNIVNSSPLSNLRETAGVMRDHFESKMEYYDALAAGFATIPECFQNAADKVGQVSLDLPDVYVDLAGISTDSAETFASGILQSMLAVKSNRIQFTDKDGITYAIECPELSPSMAIEELTTIPPLYMKTASGDVPLLIQNESGEYELNQILVGTQFSTVQNYGSSIKDNLINIYWSLFHNDSFTSMSIKSLIDVISEELGVIEAYSTIEEGLQWICRSLDISTVDKTISDMAHDVFVKVKPQQDYRAPILYVTESLIDTCEINDAYHDLCNAALSSDPYNNLLSLKEQYQDAKLVKKQVYNRASESYRQGGIRGLINFLVAFFRGGNSIKDSDGVLTFTDDSGLLPVEFIGGVVSAIVSTLAGILSVILLVFGNILGMILSIIGAIVSNLWSAVTGTKDDVYASLTSNVSEGDITIPCLPIAVWSGEVYVDEDFGVFLLSQYREVGDVCYFSVPGGMLFVGPGAFNEEGQVTKMRYELHPLSIISKVALISDLQDTTYRSYSSLMSTFYNPFGSGYDEYHILKPNVCTARSKQSVMDVWKQYVSASNAYITVITNDAETSHLSATDDLRLRTSLCQSLGFFFLWMLTGQTLNPSLLNPIVTQLSYYSDSESYSSDVTAFISLCILCALGSKQLRVGVDADFGCTWKKIVTACNYISSHREGYYFKILCNNDNETVAPTTDGQYLSMRRLEDYNQVFRITVHQYTFADRVWDSFVTSATLPMPNKFYYDVNVPKYNAATYWLWVALGAAVAVGVAVGTVVATVKFKQFCKKKRATNKQKFDSAQANYNDALDGVRREIEYDEQSGEWKEKIYKVDPASEEGKALIASTWKDYKKTARTNNLWQYIVGGSRYDVSTFWGEAEAPTSDESLSFSEKYSALFVDESANSSQVASPSQASIESLIIEKSTETNDNLIATSAETNNNLDEVYKSIVGTPSTVM